MTLSSSPSPADILAELGLSRPYTFQTSDARPWWLADLATSASLIFPTSFANKQSIKVVATSAQTAGSGSKTFSSVSFGQAYTGRVLIACTCLYTAGVSALDVTGVTIGGVSASGYDNGEFIGSGPTIGSGIWAASVPSGTSGNVVVTHGGTASHAGLILLSVASISTSAYDQQTIPATAMGIDGSGGTSVSDTINIPSNGILVVASAHSNTNNTSLSGVTEKSEITVGGGRLCVGFDNRKGAQTGDAYSASWSGTAARGFTARSYAQ